MKLKILLLTVPFVFTACDSPRSNRAYLGGSSTFTTNAANNSSSNTTSGSSNSSSTTSDSDNSNKSNTTTTTSNFPTDVNNCSFSSDGTNNYEKTSNHLGAYNLCKSTSNGNTFYFQLKKLPVDGQGNSVQVCFIPMTTSGSNSIYVGNPMCGSFTNNTTVKTINFVKYTTYANATINAVMFFKDTSYYYSAFNGYTNTLNAFQSCMNALYYGNSTYCNSFKSTGQYVFQSFN